MNTLLTTLIENAEATGRGLTCAPVDGLGASQFDQTGRTSWAQVHQSALAVAGALADAGVRPRDSVAVLAGSPGEIAPLVQGIWLAGASITMLQHPNHRSDLSVWAEDTRAALAAVGATTLVLGDPFLAAADQLAALPVRLVRLAELLTGSAGRVGAPAEDDIAFLQLTSGSTGTPKAVAVTYRNIAANTRAMIEASGASAESDVVVSWLPLYHDMGMMGFLINPMVYGLETVKITPSDFLADPLLWAELITEHRGTMTAAPNFAYAVLARRLGKAPDGAYDLSSLRFALSGAEAIDIATLDRLVAEGGRFGFRREAIVPAYGMAEATLAVSFLRAGEDYRALPVDPTAPEDRSGGLRLALGSPLDGCEIRVVDERRAPLPALSSGEFEIRGDNVAVGYRTERGFERAADEAGWLPTGDLGYLTEDGQPVICGRKKDILIVSGRNLHPEDVERAAAAVEGVRSGNVVAVRLRTAEAGEGFAMVVESARHADEAERERIRREVADRVYRSHGVSPRHVHVAPTGWIPKTSSGKFRRAETSARLANHPTTEPTALGKEKKS
ncbi:fatty acyl-AMP ligase [Segniliparus rugosus]|nr:fatty acyl-AMP ligase [Segniliparus rugosus]